MSNKWVMLEKLYENKGEKYVGLRDIMHEGMCSCSCLETSETEMMLN